MFSVYSVVLVDKITTEYTENTEKTRNKKRTWGDWTPSGMNQNFLYVIAASMLSCSSVVLNSVYLLPNIGNTEALMVLY